MIKLINHLKNNMDKYKNNENNKYIKNLIDRTREIYIMETPSEEKYTSYTVNKGEKIYFCLLLYRLFTCSIYKHFYIVFCVTLTRNTNQRNISQA